MNRESAEKGPSEQDAIIRSIAGENLRRESMSKPSLRHYTDRGYIVVVERTQDAEPHPLAV